MDQFGLPTSEWQHLAHESLDLLRRLLRVDTSNPPGNETVCATLLRDYLRAAGVPAQLVGELPHRQNVVARLAGDGDGPTLLLLGHLDVVPAEPDAPSPGRGDGRPAARAARCSLSGLPVPAPGPGIRSRSRLPPSPGRERVHRDVEVLPRLAHLADRRGGVLRAQRVDDVEIG